MVTNRLVKTRQNQLFISVILPEMLCLAGRNLKEWLQEQFCDKPLEQDDMRLHNAAYVGDLDTLRNLLQEDGFRRCGRAVIRVFGSLVSTVNTCFTW